MRALITGICGFAGSHLAEYLLAQGDQVLGCARAARWPAGLSHLADRVPLVGWDMSGPPAELTLRLAAFRPTHVFHLAAIDRVNECEADPQLARRVNVAATADLLELLSGLPESPAVLLSGSGQVYGNPPSDNVWVGEDAPLRPGGVYGETKLAGEKLAAAAKSRGQRVVIARAFNHTGPRQSSVFVVPEWAGQLARADEAPLVVQSLDTWLDLSDVRDIVRAYRLLIEAGEAGEAYNVGSGQARRTGDILEALMRLAGTKRPVVEQSPGRKQRAIGRLDRLQATISWQAEIPWEQTLADVLAYWRTSPSRPE